MEQVLSRPPDGWVRLNDIARETRRYGQTLRTFATRDLPEAEWCRVRRTQGGGPEVWVSPTGAALVREAYPPLSSGADWGEFEPRGATTEHHGATPERSSLPGGAGGLATVETEAHQGGEVVHHGGTTEERGASTNEHDGAPGSGWRVALEEARLRAETVAAERDRLIDERALFVAEVQTWRETAAELQERVGELERRADVSETQTRRARADADRWRSEAEAVRLGWHTWRRALATLGRWALVRRRFPPEPPEFTSGPALTRQDD